MNTNKKATGSSSKRLLAALAVLAVAFVVLAAVPAVATDSDAAVSVTWDTASHDLENDDGWSVAFSYGTISHYRLSSTEKVAEHTKVKYDAGTKTYTVSGIISGLTTASSSNTGVINATPAYSSAAYADWQADYAMFGLAELRNSDTDVKIYKLVQTTTAGSYFADDTRADGSKVWTQVGTTDYYTNTSEIPAGLDTSSEGILFLVPTDGSTYTIELYTSAASAAGNVPDETLVFSFDDTSVLVTLGSSAVGQSGDKVYYDGSSKLALTDYSGNLAFKSSVDLTVEVSGSNVLNTHSAVDGDDLASILADGKTLKVVGADSTANNSLTIVQDNARYGLRSTQANVGSAVGVTIGDGTNKLTVSASGGYYGINSNGGIAVVGAGTLVDMSDSTIRPYIYPSNQTFLTVSGGASLTADMVEVKSSSATASGTQRGAVKVSDEGSSLTVGGIWDEDGLSVNAGITIDIDEDATMTLVASDRTGAGIVQATTMDVNGTLAVASGAEMVTSATITVSGTASGAIAFQGSGAASASGTGSVSGVVSKKAYTVTIDTGIASALSEIKAGSNPSTLNVDLPMVASDNDKTITITVPQFNAGYKLGTVYYKVGSGAAVPIKSSTDDVKATYTFTPTDVNEDIVIYATQTGALSATFIMTNPDDASLSKRVLYSDLTPSTSVSVPSYSESGYTLLGWYTDAGLSEAVASSVINGSTCTLSNDSIVVYGAVKKTYNVMVDYGTDGVNKVGGTASVDKPVTYAGDIVKISASTADATYKIVSASATPAINKLSASTVNGKTFEMPASDVTITVTFAKVYDVSAAVVTGGTINGFAAENKTTTTFSTSSYTAAAGETVYVKITPNTGKAVGDIYYYAADDTEKAKVASLETVKANSVYSFTMPAYAVVVTSTFLDAYQIVVTDSDPSDENKVTADPEYVVPGNTATLKVELDDGYVLTGLIADFGTGKYTVALGTDGQYVYDGIASVDGGYTFAMPSHRVSVTFEVAEEHEITSVSKTGGGNVSYDETDVTGVKDRLFVFTIRSDDGIALKGITVYDITYTTSGTTTTSTLSTTEGYDSSRATNANWTVSGSTYTFKMPANDVSIVFEFEDIFYYTPVDAKVNGIAGASSDAGTVQIYSAYDAETGLSGEVTDLSKVPAGTYYLVLTAGEGYKVTGSTVNWSYKTDAEATSYTNGKEISLVAVGTATEDYAIYSFVLSSTVPVTSSGATTDVPLVAAKAVVAATFGVLTFTVSADEEIENGSIVLYTDAAFTTAAGATVPYGTVLYIKGIPAEGYVMTSATATVDSVASPVIQNADGSWTYTVKDDVAISVAFAVGYDVALPETQENFAVSSSTALAAAGQSVVIKLEVAEGYELDSIAVKNGSSTVSLTDNEDGTYTFAMPAADVAIEVSVKKTVEPTPGPSAGEATEVFVTIGTRNGATVIQLTGIDGYVPAGKITLSLTAEVNGASFTYAASFAYTNADERTTDFVALDAAEFEYEQSAYAQLLSSVYAVSVQYTSGSVSSESTPTVLMTFVQE